MTKKKKYNNRSLLHKSIQRIKVSNKIYKNKMKLKYQNQRKKFKYNKIKIMSIDNKSKIRKVK